MRSLNLGVFSPVIGEVNVMNSQRDSNVGLFPLLTAYIRIRTALENGRTLA